MKKAVYCRYEYIFAYYDKVPNSKIIIFNWIRLKIRLLHYAKPVRSTNGSRGSSVTTVTGIQAVGYQARKGAFSLFLSLQIGTDAHIHFFWIGPTDKAAGAWNWIPSISCHEDEGSAGCTSCCCIYCCCIEETECCDRLSVGGYRTEQRIKLAALCVIYISNIIPIFSYALLKPSCSNNHIDRLR